MLEFITDEPLSDDAISSAFGHSDSFQRAPAESNQVTYELAMTKQLQRMVEEATTACDQFRRAAA